MKQRMARNAGIGAFLVAALGAAGPDAVPQTEISDAATLPPAGPHQVLVLDPVYNHAKDGRAYLVDADAAAIQGMIPVAFYGNVVRDPVSGRFYVSETIWTRGNRGTRQDLLSVYDPKTLQLTKEIELPGRALITTKKQDLDISADGKYVYIYNMAPANAVIVVDTATQKAAANVGLPGCALAFPFGANGFASICADGSLATVTLDASAKATVARIAPFFAPDHDPVFEQSPTDRQTGMTYFISYTGLVYPTKLAARPEIGQPWSISEAAGQTRLTTDPLTVAWRPGGWQVAALHRKSGHLYVLMHSGPFWTHKNDGTEVWEIDVATHKLIRRITLKVPSPLVGVSQDDKPLLYTTSDDGKFAVYDAETGAYLRGMDKLGDNPVLSAAIGE
ncbi:MAG TPA: amine dehydrogenase large subunit [Acetobacteraceae bacterium]|nr:amine dehydrogenase large subunit [Acetobacteraceae bacterium]